MMNFKLSVTSNQIRKFKFFHGVDFNLRNLLYQLEYLRVKISQTAVYVYAYSVPD